VTVVSVKLLLVCRADRTFCLVWFDFFYCHPFSYTCNTGHVNYRLQFTTYPV